jgi:hypothetical protein
MGLVEFEDIKSAQKCVVDAATPAGVVFAGDRVLINFSTHTVWFNNGK